MQGCFELGAWGTGDDGKETPLASGRAVSTSDWMQSEGTPSNRSIVLRILNCLLHNFQMVQELWPNDPVHGPHLRLLQQVTSYTSATATQLFRGTFKVYAGDMKLILGTFHWGGQVPTAGGAKNFCSQQPKSLTAMPRCHRCWNCWGSIPGIGACSPDILRAWVNRRLTPPSWLGECLTAWVIFAWFFWN